MTKDEHKFLFSVIMPIYNVEDYIEEAILSLVNQTIGFDKIQLIMINDGSPDNSEAVCLKYKEQYPDNIVYKKIPNGGVSNARNTAFQYVDAKYITFLDPDDKWELSSFENAYKFLKNIMTKLMFLLREFSFLKKMMIFIRLITSLKTAQELPTLKTKKNGFPFSQPLQQPLSEVMHSVM